MGLQFILGDATTDHTQTMAAMIHEKLTADSQNRLFYWYQTILNLKQKLIFSNACANCNRGTRRLTCKVAFRSYPFPGWPGFI